MHCCSVINADNQMQVSRRVRSADYVARLAQDGRQGRHAVRYSPACLTEQVFLHPRSCLAKTAPEYVVYGDIVRTAKRPYLALVTAIEPQWLADCGSSLCSGESGYVIWTQTNNSLN
jgi:ATP-dependent RNA helicase DHX37/DHR1